jgi:hypothetical protein
MSRNRLHGKADSRERSDLARIPEHESEANICAIRFRASAQRIPLMSLRTTSRVLSRSHGRGPSLHCPRGKSLYTSKTAFKMLLDADRLSHGFQHTMPKCLGLFVSVYLELDPKRMAVIHLQAASSNAQLHERQRLAQGQEGYLECRELDGSQCRYPSFWMRTLGR